MSFKAERAHWVALRADTDAVARLTRLAERFAVLANDKSVTCSVFAEIDIAFHDATAEASKNQVRVAIMLGINRALSEASASIAE